LSADLGPHSSSDLPRCLGVGLLDGLDVGPEHDLLGESEAGLCRAEIDLLAQQEADRGLADVVEVQLRQPAASVSGSDQREDPAWLRAGGGPEMLPVTRAAEHGAGHGRSEQFFIGARDAVDSSEAWDRDLFWPRRARRYPPASSGYPGDNPSDVGPVDESRYSSY
jgi:hypothetical protein